MERAALLLLPAGALMLLGRRRRRREASTDHTLTWRHSLAALLARLAAYAAPKDEAAPKAEAALKAETCEPCEEEEREEERDRPKLSGHEPPRSPELTVEAAAAMRTPRTALIEGDGPSADERSSFSVCLSKDASATERREQYIDWHDYFMSVAMLSAFRSKDPSRQVGACIVDPPTKRIVGIGYNGFPWGCSDELLPWARKADSWLDTKYPYVCHAELNAIMNKNTASLEGCRIYTTLFPCNE